MPGLFSRLKARDGAKARKKYAMHDLADSLPPKPQWVDAYTRQFVEPEEIHELLHCCTEELKARALDHPFLLLPFRPTSDPSAVRTFVRNFFDQNNALRGESLLQELRMSEPMVIVGVAKWCWSRVQGGVVGWDAYELFKVGESDSNMARDSFKTFIPISVENGARQRIIFDFFDLLAALAAHGKANGFGGRKLSRMAAWWAFEQKESKDGFEGGYNAWLNAADATSHLFFAYLRSLSPDLNLTGISMLPMSLAKLLQETEYPPMRPDLLMSRTSKVVMIVDTVSPTPFALLRRANHFQYRDSDKALQEFSEFEDPVQALTEECRRVLKAVSSANQSQVSSSKHSTSLRDASWSRFEDVGFSSALEEDDEDDESAVPRKPQPQSLKSSPSSANALGRPTTPSWADFLSTGFVDDIPTRTNVLLPPDKVLPPIDTQPRQRSSQSHHPRLQSESHLDPGELASITSLDLDEAFWWVWMSSLAPEESSERKAAFGRCAVVESKIRSARWLIMEEMVAGAAPEPQEGAYIAEKKGLFSWTKRGRSLARRKSVGKHALDTGAKPNGGSVSLNKASAGPDTHAKIQAKAAQLRAHENQDRQAAQGVSGRGVEGPDAAADKTNSSASLQPNIVGEASSAMKWVNKYDKGATKDAYMANRSAGRGKALTPTPSSSNLAINGVDGQNGTNGVKSLNGKAASPEMPKKDTPAAQVPTPAAQKATKQEKNETASQQKADKKIADQPPATEKPVSPKPPPKDIAPVEAPVPQEAPKPVPEKPTPVDTSAPKAPQEKKAGTLKKLFSRRNRASKLPESLSSAALSNLSQSQSVSDVTAAQHSSATGNDAAKAKSETEDDATTPKATEHAEPTYEPSMGETLSHVDTRDADEAKKEFSRFDQGPLTEQPGFVPDDDDGDATPPPIARRPLPRSNTSNSNSLLDQQPEERLSHTAGPGVQDRWAQIRKNAAERAAARQNEEYKGIRHSRTTEDGDDTSGEETIESRVARIKARVAELTGNMENVHGPQSDPTTPVSPTKSP